MTEVQAASAAFDAEVAKQLAALPLIEEEQHETVIRHHACTRKLQELFDYYGKKLPPFAFVPRLLAAGEQLVKQQEFDVAINSCFQRVVDLNLPRTNASKLDAVEKVALHVQAQYSLHSSRAAKALARDQHITHVNTLQSVLDAFAGITAACMEAIPQEQLYWLVHDATVHLYKAAEPLVRAGFYAEALPRYIFAAKALESHLHLSSLQFLTWRLQMYSAAAHCYCALIAASSNASAAPAPVAAAMSAPAPPAQSSTSTKTSSGKSATSASSISTNGGNSKPEADTPAAMKLSEAAQRFLEGGIAQINSIVRAQALDPVPPAPEVTAALQAALSQLLVLKAMFEPLPDAQPHSASTLLDTLKALGPEHVRLKALLGVLMAGAGSSLQPLQQVTLPQHLQPVLDAAVQLAAPVLALAYSSSESPPSAEEHAQLQSHQSCMPEDLHVSFLCVTYRYSQQSLLQKLLAAAKGRFAAAGPAGSDGADHASNCLAATAAVLEAVQQLQLNEGDQETAVQVLAHCLKQHSSPLATCLPGLLAAAAVKLHAAAGQLLQGSFSSCDGQSGRTQVVLEGLHEALQHSGCGDGVLRGCVALRLAVNLQQQQELDQAILTVKQGLAAITSARCEALSQLHGSADEHLRWISASRTQADNATTALLEGMSQTEQELACIHADALLLLQRLNLAVGLREAAKKAATKREQLLATTFKRDRQSDIFGTRTIKEKRTDEAAIEAAGKAPSNASVQERHLMLECGKNCYQRALLMTQIAAYQPDAVQQQSLLEEACDLLQAAQAAEAALFAAQQPSAASLAASSQHNKILQPKILSRTLHSITLTHFPLNVRGYKRPASFAAYCKPTGAGVGLSINKTAMEYPGTGVKVPLGSRITIEGLQSNETYIFALAVFDEQGELIGELGSSSPSVIMALPLPLYACWAQVLLTAANLQHWQTAKRAAYVLLPRFIATSPERPIWQAHPMDRHQLQLQQVQAAAAPLLRLLVQAVYVYAYQLGQQQQQVDAAALRAGAAAASTEQPAASGLAGTAASRALLLQMNQSKVPAQVAVLEACKKLMSAMQVAAVIGDEMLVEEGALRTYDLLAPLLQQRDISPLLHQPLATLHLALTAVKDNAPASLQGHSHQRVMAARLTAAVSFWLMRLSAPISPSLAVGAAAGAVGCVTGKVLQPAAAFARLDCALVTALKAGFKVKEVKVPGDAAATVATGQKLTPRSSTAGNAGKAAKSSKQQKAGVETATTAATTTGAAAATQMLSPAEAAAAAEQQVELNAAVELALMHPDGMSWASPTLTARFQDASDLAAQVLPKLSQPDPLATCWPLLSPDTARSNSRWLPLCVLVMESAAQQHGHVLLLAMPPTSGPGNLGLGLGSVVDSVREFKTAKSPAILAAAAAGAELLAAVQQHVRLVARRPQFLDWPREPRWTVASAAAALEAQGFALGDQGTLAAPAAPQLAAGASAQDQAAAMAAWEQQKQELLVKERQRLAAALLLQQRLPVLLQRRRSILASRRQLAALAPWLGKLHRLMGSLAAEAVGSIAASQPGNSSPTSATSTLDASVVSAEETEALAAGAEGSEGAAADPNFAAAAGAGTAGSRPASPRKGSTNVSPRNSSSSRPGSPPKKTATPRSGQKEGGKDGKAAVPDVLLGDEELMQQLGLQALQQFAQAAVLTSRAGPAAWQELLNSIKQLWNVTRHLINHVPVLTLPLPAVAWVQGLLPGPKVPALAAEAADRAVNADGAAKGAEAAAGKVKGAAAADKKGAVGDKGVKGAAAGGDKRPGNGVGAGKGGKPGMPVVPEPMIRQLMLPEARLPNAAASLRMVAEALLSVLQQLRLGVTFHPGVIPAGAATVNTATATWATGPTLSSVPGACMPTASGSATARSTNTAAAATEFSLGSDAVTVSWHVGGPVDVTGLTRLVLIVLKVLHRMERWTSLMSIGRGWLDVCEGSADASLLPLMLAVAPKAGSAAEVAALTAASQALMRDKNAAFDALDKVRARVAERLSNLPLLTQQGSRILLKPNRRAAGATSTTKSGSNTSRSNYPASLAHEPSGMSAVTATTGGAGRLAATKSSRSLAGTMRTGGAAADHVFLPAEYEKVVELLKKRGEKGHMILAMNELGDVYAHFGMWPAAAAAWGGALDTLLGPYQVVTNWTAKLALGSWQQLLGRYGVHGLLLAGTLLGKLARYAYYEDLNSRLSCARLAAELLPAVFASSIIHPQRAVDCALYVPVELWPGVDVFDDPYRCNATDLLSSLETLCNILLEHQRCLQVLPLLALWEHTATAVTHSTSSLQLARVTRVKALCQLGMLAEAGLVVRELMQGKNLPGVLVQSPQPILGPDGVAVNVFEISSSASSSSSSSSSSGPSGKSAAPSGSAGTDAAGAGLNAAAPVFDASKWPGHPSNAAFLDYVCDAVLQPCIAEVYGPWLCGQVAVARSVWLAAAGSAPNCWRSSDAAGGAAAAAAASHGNASSGVSGTHNAASGKGSNAPSVVGSSEPVEGRLLDKAAKMLQVMVINSRKAAGLPAFSGIAWDQEGAEAGDSSGSSTGAKGAGKEKGNKGGKGNGGKAGKNADKRSSAAPAGAGAGDAGASAAATAVGGADGMDQLLGQHQHLVVAGLMQLAEVELLRWMPARALQLSMAASAVIIGASSRASTSAAAAAAAAVQQAGYPSPWQACGGSNDDLERAALHPVTWLAVRCQLAHVLLQLQHYGPCVSVAVKAIADAKAVGDVVWGVRLQQLQANALAAQGEAAGALTVMGDAAARLHDLALPGPLLLSLQLDTALLCEELGARGEVDRLAGLALANSSSIVEEQGLQEMMDNPELLNIYLPATSTHIAALSLAATTATRRRQLATAERHLRHAMALLPCCRSLPITHSRVLLQLAHVLRLQAALKLPATDMVVAKASTAGAGTSTAATVPAAAGQEDAEGPAPVAVKGAELQRQRLGEAASLLSSALRVLVNDAGGHAGLVRAALLELAAVWLYSYQLATPSNTSSSNASIGSAATAAGTASPVKVAAALQASHVTAGHLRVLQLTSHQLQPVNNPTGNLPGWLLDWLKGQEALQSSMQQQSAAAAAAAAVAAGRPAGGSSNSRSSHNQKQQQQHTGANAATPVMAGSSGAVPDATLGRLAVCFYVQQLSASSSGLSGLQQRQLAAAQAMQVQAALRAACPKLATDCCWSEVPVVGAAAAAAAAAGAGETAGSTAGGGAADASTLPTGAVLVQWYRQDCCWQVPASWRSDGSLPPQSSSSSSQPITRDMLHALPDVPAHASCMYVVNLPVQPAAATAVPVGVAGKEQQQQPPCLLVGEVVVSLERLKRVQLQVKSLRRRLETPGRPTDLFAQGPPSSRELAAAKHSLEGLLSGTDEEDMGPAPLELPSLPAPAAASAGTAAGPAPGPIAGGGTAAAGAAAAVVKPGAAAAAGKVVGGAAVAAAGQAGAGGAGVSSAHKGALLVLDWRDVSTWIKMEALLDVEDGLQGDEKAVAAWLAGVIGQHAYN